MSAAAHPARLNLIFCSGPASAMPPRRLVCTCSAPVARRCLRLCSEIAFTAAAQFPAIFFLVFLSFRFFTGCAATCFGNGWLHVLFVVRSPDIGA
jgi:hypothetical protein